MSIFKRITLFVLTNLAIIIVLTVVMQVFGIEPYLNQNGLNLTSLLIFSAVIGFTGSLISLFTSKMVAKWTTGAQVIKTPQNQQETQLLQSVKQLATQAGIGMPEVAIYPSSELNAFATGSSRNNSLVAISAGLLEAMNQEEIDGVLAHEIAHIQNGDMVTMTLIQGVVNTFVIFAARVAAYGVERWMGREDLGWLVRLGLIIVFEIVFGILASLLVMAVSRHREFRADFGAAKLGGKSKMIKALQFLQNHQGRQEDHAGLATMKMSQKPKGLSWWSSHPPLQNRIETLQKAMVA